MEKKKNKKNTEGRKIHKSTKGISRQNTKDVDYNDTATERWRIPPQCSSAFPVHTAPKTLTKHNRRSGHTPPRHTCPLPPTLLFFFSHPTLHKISSRLAPTKRYGQGLCASVPFASPIPAVRPRNTRRVHTHTHDDPTDSERINRRRQLIRLSTSLALALPVVAHIAVRGCFQRPSFPFFFCCFYLCLCVCVSIYCVNVGVQ